MEWCVIHVDSDMHVVIFCDLLWKKEPLWTIVSNSQILFIWKFQIVDQNIDIWSWYSELIF